MPIGGCWRLLLAAGTLMVAVGGATPPGPATEPAGRFLRGLRARGLHDVALLYLDQAKTSRLVADDFRQSIPYERGVTWLELALHTDDPKIRHERLVAAQVDLEAFVQAHSSTPLAVKARGRLADVLLDRGRALLRQSERPADTADRAALRAEARQLFEQGRVSAEENEQHCTGMLKELPKFLDPNREASTIDQRDQLRSELLSSKLMAATAIYEHGKSFPGASTEYQKQIGEAAARYGAIYEKYRTRLAGLHARLWEGQCYRALNQPEKALRCAKDLLLQSAGEQAVRVLIAKAVKLRGDCLMPQEKYDQVIDGGTRWLDQARDAEQDQADWLAVKYQVAAAHLQKAAAGNPPERSQRRHLQQARTLAREVVRHPNPYQKQARVLLTKTGVAEQDARPVTFAGALAAAQEALDLMQTAKVGLELARQNNPASVPELTQQFEAHRDAAASDLHTALRLADATTPVDQINQARYYLCYLNWELGRYYNAAILGQFLAHHYPDSGGARRGAKIALASYQRVYAEPGNTAPEFEVRQLVAVANLITRQWPNQPDADDAYTVLVSVALERGQWRQALEYLTKIAPDRRGPPQTKAGLALWGHVLRAARQAPANRPAAAELDRLKRDAQASLESGIELLKGHGEIEETLVTAALSLAQIYLDSSQYERAVAVLEDQRVGPLTLLAVQHPATRRAGFAEEAYKAALRAYVSVQPPRSEQAQQVMDLMDNLFSKQDHAEAADTLIKIYISLGQQLQGQLQRLRETGQQQELERVSQAFESLLDRVTQRKTGADWAARNWIAQTYASLGAGLQQGDQTEPKAQAYLEKAVAAYDTILQQATETPTFAPNDDAVLDVMMRKADCLRQLGRFDQALRLLTELLVRKPNTLDAQVAAARTYQQRGDREDPKWYVFAWQGGRKDRTTGKNWLWGWARIARATARFAQYRDVFHEARYHLALCRFKYALKQRDNNQQKYLRLAKDDIRFTANLYPDLGGATWRPQYDSLLQRIQQHLHETPLGLQEFDPPDRPDQPAAAGTPRP